MYAQIFSPELSHPTRRHIYPGLLCVYIKGDLLCEMSWPCAFLLYVLILFIPLSGCPPVNTFIEGLLCTRHSAGCGDLAVNQAYFPQVIHIKTLGHNWIDYEPRHLRLRQWASSCERGWHHVGKLSSATGSLGILTKKHEGGETGSAWLGTPVFEVSKMKKCDTVFFLWCQFFCHSGC